MQYSNSQKGKNSSSQNNNNRPAFSAHSSNLGSQCPVILKHDFPNESKDYLDDVFQEMSATQKRFKYSRPLTAKNSISYNNKNKSNKTTLHNTRNIQSSKFENNNYTRPFTAKQHPQSAMQSQTQFRKDQMQQQQSNINSADLYKKLLQNKGKDNPDDPKNQRFRIKPVKKLNTFQIHNALYKVKEKKEELDRKIQELEEKRTNFNQKDFYFIANAGSMDQIFNNTQRIEKMQQSYLNQNNFMSETQKRNSMSRSNIYSRVQSAKSKKNQKPEYLQPTSSQQNNENYEMEDEFWQNYEQGRIFEDFKLNQRQDVENWGEPIEDF